MLYKDDGPNRPINNGQMRDFNSGDSQKVDRKYKGQRSFPPLYLLIWHANSPPVWQEPIGAADARRMQALCYRRTFVDEENYDPENFPNQELKRGTVKSEVSKHCAVYLEHLRAAARTATLIHSDILLPRASGGDTLLSDMREDFGVKSGVPLKSTIENFKAQRTREWHRGLGAPQSQKHIEDEAVKFAASFPPADVRGQVRDIFVAYASMRRAGFKNTNVYLFRKGSPDTAGVVHLKDHPAAPAPPRA